MHLQMSQIFLAAIAALLVGFSKTGVPSAGIFTVTLMAMIFPAKESVGVLLPMLITGDIIAVAYYRRQVVWKHLISLIPWVLVGIVLGYFVLKHIQSPQLKVMIGVLVLALVVLHVVSNKWGEKLFSRFIGSFWFNALMGILAGFATMVGNAAGGVMSLYLLSKNLPKNEFIGTGAWFFFTVNLLKVPFTVYLGLITPSMLVLNAWVVPLILLGAFIGIKVLPKIPQKHFQMLILVLSVIGAINLIL